jgi:hypothetical protein
MYSLDDSETPSNFIAIRLNFATIGTSLDSRSIKDKSISGEKVLRQNCLDSITSTSTVALSTSTEHEHDFLAPCQNKLYA